MTISYPLSLPTSPSFMRVTLSSAEAVGLNRSPWTFATYVQEHQGMAWQAEVTLPIMNRTDAENWIAFLLKLRGSRGTFLLGDPLGATPRGSAGGTPLVNGGSQTGQSLVTDGWPLSATGVLKAGDYIQLGQNLYKVLDDTNSNGSGQATFDIWPRLRSSPADNAAITVTNTKGLFRLQANVNQIWTADEARTYGLGFSAVEAI